MWGIGELDGYEFYVKHFENGSEYGINEGKISKLEIRKDGRTVANYDRGWDMEPQDAATQKVYEKILEKFN